MAMPYEIKNFPAPNNEPRPYKVYANGNSCPASEEEVQAWEHVKHVEAKLTIAGVREATLQEELAKAGLLSPVNADKQPAVAPQATSGRRATR